MKNADKETVIYVTGSNGFIGTEFVKKCPYTVKTISYRDEVLDVFESHENSCLVHFAWSTTTRTSYDEIEKSVKNDVSNSKKLFDFYSKKNPNGKIIFLSSAGDLHLGYERIVDETFPPSPRTLYGDCKLQVENIINTINCNTVTLRVSNVWGGKNLRGNRVNGLVDILIKNLNTDEVIELYADLNTKIDIIHIDDLVDLINKVIEKNPIFPHQTYLVGGQSLSIIKVIDIISSNGSLLIKFNRKQNKTYLHIDNSRVRTAFDWNQKIKLV
jgi:nucleoside-diphosphate-sugar epimerase